MNNPDLKSLDPSCAGTGYLNCECGGDFCACQLQGGMVCPGCPDCEEDEFDEANRMPDCEQCGGELSSGGFCYECQA